MGRFLGMTKTEAKWSEEVRQWRESEQELARFVVGKPYKAATLRWWATELRRREREGVLGGRRKEGTAAPTIRLARVVARQRRDESLAKALILEVSGARISLERGFDAELLGAVVRALWRRS
jgi:hypothetical protein